MPFATNVRSWPIVRIGVHGCDVLWRLISVQFEVTTVESGRTNSIELRTVRPSLQMLDLGLLRDLQGVIYLDPKVSDGAFQLAMPEQELHGP